MRKINDAGLALIKQHEGCKLKAYKDSVGVWTVGYGHTGSDVYAGLAISQDRAEELLQQDLSKFEAGVEDLVFLDINDNQFSALVCFAYNVGLNNLRHSTLLNLLNDGKFEAAAGQFIRWNKAGGKVLDGLTSRRVDEASLFVQV